MAPGQTFPRFKTLPVNIQQEIWRQCMKVVIAGPSMLMLDLVRQNLCLDDERRLVAEASQKAIEAKGPDWESLPDEAKDLVVKEAELVAARNHRASLVGVTLPKERAASQFSAYWQLGEIASVCLEARQSLERFHTGGVADIIAMWDPRKTVVCLRTFTDHGSPWSRPQIRPAAGEPFFTADKESKRQVAYVTIDNESGWYAHSRVKIAMDPARCAPLGDSCPELAAMERVAFFYAVATLRGNKSYRTWAGLEDLWPFNFPNLKELYMIDESISLQVGFPSPPESTLKIEGYDATFYEVTEEDGDTWSPSPGVFAQVEYIKEGFEEWARPGDTLPAVKVLACIPHSKQ
ncbi:uncharacterized protein B0H64DRAFT_436316 [Chaetomium fimeti]|uniref:Uncharacterized protein n=1 Tax=Chaetomium fimeti TaxID=1854472 RepID=A0AAE0LMK0_9PEZI|nr:hypothetical protein B0H64DRAFT_436316 [Chaetomium fimeti]